MPEPSDSESDSVGARAVALRDLLAGVRTAPVAVERWERLEPWAVARVRVRGADVPPSVVVKWAEGGPVQGRGAGWRLRTEVAALRFLRDDVGIGLAPRVIAADPAAGFAVLEDLAPRTALDRLLRRDGAAAHGDRLAAFARALGELGAATAGRAEGYYARRAGLGPVDPAADRAGRLAPYRDRGIERAVGLGVPLEAGAATEMGAVVEELAAPGPFLALSNGDAAANNVLLHASGPADARLIDFEFAGYAHALTDAVCLYVPGPAWMTVGDPAGGTGVADHYRRALARGVPEAEDDRRYGFGLAAACVSWALIRLERFALLDTRPPGDRSRPQLVATLEAAAHTARSHRALPHLTAWLQRIATLLRGRWPDADQDFADPVRCPAYQPRHAPSRPWDDTLFSGTAAYYRRGRLPYAPGLADVLAEVLRLDRRGRLIDVGCGPGTLALGLAQVFHEVVGVDPDRGMIDEAGRGAVEAGVAGKARWVRIRAEDLPADLGSFTVATFGQSFHWMDRDLVAATVRGMLRPGGALVHISDLKTETRTVDGLPYPAVPYAAIDELVRRYLGPVRRAGRGLLPQGTPGGEAAVLARAGFSGPRRVVVPGGQALERTTDDVVAGVFSMSFSAPHLFGARREAFEADLRGLLRAASPAGRFSERQPSTEVFVWGRDSTPL